MAFDSFRSRRASAFFSRSQSRRRPRPSNRIRPGGPRRLEALEARLALTTFYVDGQLQLTADRDASGGLSAGDQVTFGNGQSYQQAHLTYDAAPAGGDAGTAFNSIGQALSSSLLQPGDTIEIAGGTYAESGLTIDKSLTLEGEGDVVIAGPANISPQGVAYQYDAHPGLSIIDQPDHVAIKNVGLKNFQTSLSDSGGGTLDLIDVNMMTGDASISNLDNLDVVSDSTSPQTVIIDIVRYVQPGFVHANHNASSPDTVLDNLWIEGMSPITFSGVKHLRFATAAGSHDTISASPLPDTTVTIDGNDSTPGGAPGDTLQLPTNFDPGSSLTATKDSTGLSGTWTPGNGQPVNFMHIASLLPGIVAQNVPPIAGAQGVDTGSQVVAKFIDAAADALAAGVTAEIYWGDDSHSTGTIAYDATTGVYSVLGSHAYSEGGSYTIDVSLQTPSGAVILPHASANITSNTEPQLIQGQSWTLMPTVGETTGTQGIVTFSDSVHLPASDYSAEIDWGDGTSSAGTISSDPIRWTFMVSGNHVYTQTGIDHILVTIFRNGASAGTLSAAAAVSNQPLQVTPVTLTGTAGVALGGASGTLVATFEEQQTDTSNFQATVDWGDGTATAGTVVKTSDSSPLADNGRLAIPVANRIQWQVDGSHTYAKPGDYLIHVSLTENGNVVSAIDSRAKIAAASQASSYQAFVTNVYHDLLHRLADAGGLDYWASRLAAGLSRAELAADIENTAEYRHDEIDSLFEHYLHRHADAGALDSLGAQLAAGKSDEAIAAAIAGSDEYFQLQGGTNDGFLAGLFNDALGRPIDPAAKTALEQALAQGASRQQIALTVLDSHEYHVVVVDNAYAELLNRSAEAAGDAHWADALDRGLADEQLLASVAESQEYFKG